MELVQTGNSFQQPAPALCPEALLLALGGGLACLNFHSDN